MYKCYIILSGQQLFQGTVTEKNQLKGLQYLNIIGIYELKIITNKWEN